MFGAVSTLSKVMPHSLLVYDYVAIVGMLLVLTGLVAVAIDICKKIYYGKLLLSIRNEMLGISILGIFSLVIYGIRYYLLDESYDMNAIARITFYLFILCVGILPMSLLELISAFDDRLTARRRLVIKLVNFTINALLCLLSCVAYFYPHIDVSYC